MKAENEQIQLIGEEALAILSEVEYILISLRDIARHYYHGETICDAAENELAYCRETTGFIDRNRVTHRLAKVRAILSAKFNDELGDDDMGDLEREMEKIRCWEKPGD